MTKRNKILNDIKEMVNQTAPNSEVFLYGSRARGKAHSYSDWDILVLVNSPKLAFDFEKQFVDAFYQIEIETGAVISPLIYTKSDWETKHVITPLFENIQNEGIRLL